MIIKLKSFLFSVLWCVLSELLLLVVVFFKINFFFGLRNGLGEELFRSVFTNQHLSTVK